MLYLIRQSLLRRRVVLTSTLFGIASGVAILFAVWLLYIGVQQGTEVGEKRLGADLLVVPRAARVAPETALFTGAPLNIYMSGDIQGQIARIPGVEAVTTQFFSQTLNDVCCSLQEPTRLVGFDPDSDWVVSSLLGDSHRPAIGPRTVLLGSGIQGVLGNQMGILGEPFFIAGILPPTGTGLDASILMPMESAKALAKKSPALQKHWQVNGPPDPLISSVLVRLQPGADRKQIATAVEAFGPYQVIASSDVFYAIKNHLTSLLSIVLFCGILASVGALLQLFSRLYAMVWDRKAEWGLYRSLGASKSDLFRLIAGESLAMALGGIVLGLLTGSLLYKGILAYLLSRQSFPFLAPSWGLTGEAVLTIVILFGFGALLAAWLPAVRAAAIDPSSAMARADID